jgi:hypothetical protein
MIPNQKPYNYMLNKSYQKVSGSSIMVNYRLSNYSKLVCYDASILFPTKETIAHAFCTTRHNMSEV